MKKSAIILAAVLTMAAATTAFAETSATYGSENNQVTVGDDINTYSTVLITNDRSDDIVYVNQESDVFSASMDFLLKNEPDPGEYTVLLGNASGSTKTAKFVIGSVKTQLKMDRLDEEQSTDGTYKLAFTLTDDISDYNVITVKVGDKMGGFYIDDVFGHVSGYVNLGLQINNVPMEDKDKIEVYLGTGSLGSSYKNWDAE